MPSQKAQASAPRGSAAAKFGSVSGSIPRVPATNDRGRMDDRESVPSPYQRLHQQQTEQQQADDDNGLEDVIPELRRTNIAQQSQQQRYEEEERNEPVRAGAVGVDEDEEVSDDGEDQLPISSETIERAGSSSTSPVRETPPPVLETPAIPSTSRSSSPSMRNGASVFSVETLQQCFLQPERLKKLTVSELRGILKDKHVPYDDILERREMEERVFDLLSLLFGGDEDPRHRPSSFDLATEAAGPPRNASPATATVESRRSRPPRDAESDTCKICFDEDVSILFLECAHACSCEPCSRQLLHCPVVSPSFFLMRRSKAEEFTIVSCKDHA